LSVIISTKNWAGNWQKFIGGNGDLKLEFSTYSDPNFVLPYITEDKEGKYLVKILKPENGKDIIIDIPNFGTKYKSLIIVPSLQKKRSGFSGTDVAQPFNYSVSVGSSLDNPNQPLMQQLLEQIESLKRQIAQLQARLGGGGQVSFCKSINNNLYFGIAGDDVKCLQNFLKSQGQGIYPEGLITGNFGGLTQKAVIRFQEKYAVDILTPMGLSKGTGYVGQSTRNKINQILSAS
jgi:hypothetical protein